MEGAPVEGPLPDELETYQLLKVGLSLAEVDEIEDGRAQELLEIHAVYIAAEARAKRKER